MAAFPDLARKGGYPVGVGFHPGSGNTQVELVLRSESLVGLFVLTCIDASLCIALILNFCEPLSDAFNFFQ